MTILDDAPYTSDSISPYGRASQAKKGRGDEWKPPGPAEVAEKWQKVQDDMLDTRRSYFLNMSFELGDQWIRWDDGQANVNIVEFASAEEGRARATVNKLKPRLTSLLARLCRTPLTFEPRPEGIDSYAMQKARLARQILDVKAHRDGWSKVRRQNIHHLLLGGVSGILVEPGYAYDDPPIPDGLGEFIKVPSRPAPSLRALSGVEFGLEPGTVNCEDALWAIVNTTLTPLQAQRRYHLESLPAPDADAQAGAMQRALMRNRKGAVTSKGCRVLVYYERPTDESPGCVIHVLNQKTVQQDPWPFPFDELNITTFTETEIGGTWKGDTRMNDARSIQVQINKAFTSIQANINRCDNNRMLMPEGAVLDGEDDLTGEPGEWIRYNQENGKPEWMTPPDIAARGMREIIEKLESELDDLFSTHAVSRGEAPGDRNSGLALSILAEKDETPLGLIAEDQQRGWQRVAEQVLMLEKHLMTQVDQATQEYGGDPMQVTDVLMIDEKGQSRDEPKEVSWSADDLPDHPVVHVPLDAVQPRSQAAVQDVMLKLAQAFPAMFAQLGPQQLATVLMVPDANAFTHIADPHVENANWENARMASGEDETSVMVADWQPHAVHINEHNRFRATAGYRDADDQTKQFIDLHVQAHMTLLAEQVALQQQEAAQQAAAAMPPQQGEQPA